MHLIPTLFLLSLLTGQLIRIPLPFGGVIYPHDVILMIYVFLWIIWKKGHNKKIELHSLSKPFLLFVGALAVSFFLNIDSHTFAESINAVSYILRIVLYFFLYIIISNTKNPTFWLQRMYIVGVIFAILGITQYIVYPDLRNVEYLGWDPHYFRLFSTFLDPNFAGLFLILTFFLGTAFIFKRLENVRNLLFQAIVLTALLLTLSRSTYIAFALSLMAYILLKKSWKAAIGVAVFFGIILFFPFPHKSVTPLFRQRTVLARMESWSYGVKLFGQKPLLGYGFNYLRSIQGSTEFVSGNLQASHAAGGVDNSFLFVQATSGVIGGFFFIKLLFSFRNVGKKLIHSKKGKKLGSIYLLSLLAILTHSMFVNSFFYPWIMIWIWILTGVAESTLERGMRNE